MRDKSRALLSCLLKNDRVISVKCCQAEQYIHECATLKNKYGLRDGDRVLLLTENNCDMFTGFLALSVNRLAVVLADASLPVSELSALISKCNISAAFTDRKWLTLSSNRPIPVFDTWKTDSGLSVLADMPAPHDSEPTPNTAAIIFSSGTTSRTKPVELPYDCLIYAQEQNSATFYIDRFPRRHPGMTAFPMAHVSGLCICTAIFLSGRTLALIDDLTAAAIKKSFHIFQPVVFAMIPKVFDMFADGLTEEITKRGKLATFTRLRHISSFFRKKLGIRSVGRFIMTPFRRPLFGRILKGIGGGGTPWKPETLELLLDLGIRYTDLYTTTECAFYIASTGQERNPPLDAVAKADSNKYGHITICDPDENGIGEIRVKTRFIMNGYYGDPESTRAAFDENGYFITGDLGRIADNGYLYITGRKKDTILMHSGKKTSPAELAELFGHLFGSTAFAFVGMPSDDPGCDDIHLFIETESLTEKDLSELEERILCWQRSNAPLYPVRKIHRITELPKTKIGKIKSYLLKEQAAREAADGAEKTAPENGSTPRPPAAVPDDDILAGVIRLIRKYGHTERDITGGEDLLTELGVDSLDLLNIAAAIEEEYDIRLPEESEARITPAGITEYIRRVKTHPAPSNTEIYDSDAPQYPRKRNAIHRNTYRILRRLAEKLYRFDIAGLENIRPDEHYIFCPNHLSYLDGLWLCTALGDRASDPEHIGCLAKQELMRHAFTRFCITIFGAVPVDQNGNPAAAFSQLCRFLKNGNDVIIYPEGTRSTDGRLGAFKNGAADFSVMTGTSIIPVAVRGAFEAYPRSALLPRIRDKNHRKITLRFTFCKPIDPFGKSAGEITDLVRNAIRDRLDAYAAPPDST